MLKLTQDEVVEGIKLYLNNLGINTYAKDVTASFTPGRKGNPLTVEVNITQKALPMTDFSGQALITSTVTLDKSAESVTAKVIEQAKAEIQQELALEEPAGAAQDSASDESEIESTGSVLDEVMAGVEQQESTLFN